MPGKIEALGIFLILLPGFLCAYVVQSLAVRRKQTELDKVVEALLLSFLLYLPTLPFFGYSLPVSWHEVGTNSNIFQITLHWKQLVTLAIASVVLGTGYAANINHDWFLSIFRLLHVTERTARSTIWNDVFQEVGGWVQVGLAGDVVVSGWLGYYSDEAEDSSLFIEQAAWIDKEGKERLIDGPGILITKEVGIEYVVFLKSETDDTEAATGQDSTPAASA
jgi:hypothetical protein